MRNVILAAALAATFCLTQTSDAQQVSEGTAADTSAVRPSAGVEESGPGGSGQAGSQSLMTWQDPSPSYAGGPWAPGMASGMSEAGAAVAPVHPSEADPVVSPQASERTAVGTSSKDSQVELSRLRAEVERLRAELDEAKGLRRGSASTNTSASADVSLGTSLSEGTGGSGLQQEHAPQPIASSTVAGRVSKVSKKSIEVIDSETGEPYVLQLNEDSRARSGQRRIPVTRIRQGSEVRASFELMAGDTYATQIVVVGKRRR